MTSSYSDVVGFQSTEWETLFTDYGSNIVTYYSANYETGYFAIF